jgi:hypothetical protein
LLNALKPFISRYHADVTSIVRSRRRTDDDWEALHLQLTELEALLVERRAEFVRVESELRAFEVRYRHKVGTLHEQLEKLDLAIAEAELGEIAKLVGNHRGAAVPPRTAAPEATPQYTSDGVRKLFRDVAKAIHPDLATDEATRDRRHRLMIEANRAYALGDEEQLRVILEAWERSPEAVRGDDPEAIRLRRVRRIAQIEEHLKAISSDLAVLNASPLGKLKTMVDEAAAQGKDLVRDMVGRLKRDILVANNRLDAIRPPASDA